MDAEKNPMQRSILHVFAHFFVLCPKTCVLQACAQPLHIMTCCKGMCWQSFRAVTMALKLQNQADFLNIGPAHNLNNDSVIQCDPMW